MPAPSRKRLILSDRDAVYHVVSRTSCGRFLFEEREMEAFRQMMWKQAAFCGLQIIAYCVMSNHFHILVRVPQRRDVPDAELLRRYAAFYEGAKLAPNTLSPDELAATFQAGGPAADAARTKVLRRFFDLSIFLRELKQRFGIWYNKTHRNKGTIWADRFKSAVVENEASALSTCAAYIDLNPVRAEMVEDPADYRFCTYGEATGGSRRAREALKRAFAGRKRWMEAYRLILFGKGYGAKGARGKDHGKISSERLKAVIKKGGNVSLQEALRCRWRFFAEGCVIGRRTFIEEAFRNQRHFFPARRKLLSTRLKGSDWSDLSTYRRVT